jgi:hypothetical protein
MTLPQHTVVLCCIILALIVAWDTYCAINATEGDTISELDWLRTPGTKSRVDSVLNPIIEPKQER